MGFKLGRMRPFEARKLVKMSLIKAYKKRHKKHIKVCSKIVQKEGPEKVILGGFSEFHPSMVSRASLGRLPGPKAHQNGGPDMDFLLFWDHAFTFFGDTLEIFRVLHEQQIDSTRCAIYGCLCLGWGGKPMVVPPSPSGCRHGH
jgi:hypothetical protein